MGYPPLSSADMAPDSSSLWPGPVAVGLIHSIPRLSAMSPFFRLILGSTRSASGPEYTAADDLVMCESFRVAGGNCNQVDKDLPLSALDPNLPDSVVDFPPVFMSSLDPLKSTGPPLVRDLSRPCGLKKAEIADNREARLDNRLDFKSSVNLILLLPPPEAPEAPGPPVAETSVPVSCAPLPEGDRSSFFSSDSSSLNRLSQYSTVPVSLAESTILLLFRR